MDEKERQVQKALGTIKPFLIRVAGTVMAHKYGAILVEATSKIEAQDMVQGGIDCQDPAIVDAIEWDYNANVEVGELDPVTIQVLK